MGGDREEHYLELLRRFVDEQKQLLGEEVALKWARRTPLKIDSSGNVTGFYGTGSDALTILKQYMDHEQFYLKAVRAMIAAYTDFIGEQRALAAARKAPLEITADGEVKAYYGRGYDAVDILLSAYEQMLGDAVARFRTYKALKPLISNDQSWSLLPDRIRRYHTDRTIIAQGIEHIKRVGRAMCRIIREFIN